MQWLGRKGFFGPIGEKFGSTTTCAPKCATCQFAKQERNPKPGKTIKVDETLKGILKKEKLQPGDLVFSDQYESSLGGQIYSTRGHPQHSFKFKGGTLFCDAASGFIFIEHQVTLSSTETIGSMMNFEIETLSLGMEVKQYQTDNGIYTSKEYLKELDKKGQGICLSGVGEHHQNGVAETSIKLTSYKARALLIHAALRWPEVAEKDL